MKKNGLFFLFLCRKEEIVVNLIDFNVEIATTASDGYFSSFGVLIPEL